MPGGLFCYKYYVPLGLRRRVVGTDCFVINIAYRRDLGEGLLGGVFCYKYCVPLGLRSRFRIVKTKLRNYLEESWRKRCT